MTESELIARGIRGSALALVLLAGCTGQIQGGSPSGGVVPGAAGSGTASGAAGTVGGGTNGPPTGVTGVGGSGSTGPAALPPSLPKAPLRRLSRAQYNNTVRDLLGDATRPADAFIVEE